VRLHLPLTRTRLTNSDRAVSRKGLLQQRFAPLRASRRWTARSWLRLLASWKVCLGSLSDDLIEACKYASVIANAAVSPR
jgi:hypothetical protein